MHAIARVQQAGVDLDALALELQRDGVQAFVESWQSLLKRIEEKTAALGASGGKRP